MKNYKSSVIMLFMLLTFVYVVIANAAGSVHLSKIAITPANLTIMGAGQNSGNVKVYASYSDGSTQDVTQMTSYNSSNTAVAYINTDANGNKFVTSGTKTGTAKITAIYNNKSASLNVTVNSILTGISISPQVSFITGTNTAGSTIAVTANYSDKTTQNVTSLAAFTSSDTSIAYVKNGTLKSGSKSGTAVISASYGGFTTTCTVAVKASLLGINISPGSSTISGVDTCGEPVTVTENYSDGSYADVSNSTLFASSDSSIAYVKDGKLMSGSKSGTAIITATYNNKTADCVVLVVPVLKSISISPSSINFVLTSLISKSISVIASYDNGDNIDITDQASLSCSDDTIATITNNTVTSTGKVGFAAITASYGGKNASCTINVTQNAAPDSNSSSTSIVRKDLEKAHGKVTSINVSTSAAVGSQVTATSQFTDGYTLDVSPKTMFNTSNGLIAYVGNDSIGRKVIKAGGKKGTTIITAVFGGKTTPFTVTVN